MVAIGTCATYGGIPAMKNNPTGAMGAAPTTSAGTGSRRPACRSSTSPAARRSPTTRPRRCSTWCCTSPACAPVPELDEAAASEVAVRAHGARGLQPRRLHRAGQLRDRVRRRPPLPGQARLQGPGRQVQRAGPRLGRTAYGGCPNVGGICMACTMPGFPDKYMPFMDEDPYGQRRGQRRAVHVRPGPDATSAIATSRTSTTRSPSGASPATSC